MCNIILEISSCLLMQGCHFTTQMCVIPISLLLIYFWKKKKTRLEEEEEEKEKKMHSKTRLLLLFILCHNLWHNFKTFLFFLVFFIPIPAIFSNFMQTITFLLLMLPYDFCWVVVGHVDTIFHYLELVCVCCVTSYRALNELKFNKVELLDSVLLGSNFSQHSG